MRTRAAVVALMGGVLVLTTPRLAAGHALLTSSVPADGALLDTPPRQVVMEFTEPPDARLSTVEVLDSTGTPVLGVRTSVPSGRRARLVASLPDLRDGVYTVSWRVLSRVDGHVTAGSFSFGVGVDPAQLERAGPGGESATVVEGPSPVAIAGRWALYAGLALLLGLAACGLLVFRTLPARTGLTMAVACVLALTGLATMLAAERSSVGVPVLDLLGSDRGRLLLWRAAAVAAAGASAALVAVRPRRPALAILAASTSAAMLVHAFAGHAGASPTRPWLDVGVQWTHLVAVGVWVGGLVWLLQALVSGPAGRGDSVLRFSRLAAVALAVVAATGVLRAVDEVGSWGALLDSGFGLSVLGKAGLFAGLTALGAVNRYRNFPRQARGEGSAAGALRRVVAAEIVLAAGVFGLTGLMAELAPPALRPVAAAASRPGPLVATGSDFATEVRVRLEVTPGTAGANAFRARIVDFDTGAPVQARRVTLRFTIPGRPEIGGSQLVLERAGADLWQGRGTNLSVEGTWRVGVLVEQPADSVEVPLELHTRTRPQEVTVIPGGPGQPSIYTIELPGGQSVQGYVDPGREGPNEVHFTFFDAAGGELALASAAIAAEPRTGPSVEPPARRLGPGHFVAGVDLAAGRWTFSVQATTEDGTPLAARFDQDVE